MPSGDAAARVEAAPVTPLAMIPTPKWVPFSVILALVLVLLIAPFVLIFVTPEPVANKVGVFQRFSLQTAHGDSEAIGGFIAPEGWLLVTDGDPAQQTSEDAGEDAEANDDTATQPTSYTFVSPDKRDSITVEFHGDVTDPGELLQQQSPIGATLVPSAVLPPQAGLDISALDVDLRAGSASTQYLTACAQRSAPTACLLITSKAQAWFGDPRFEQREDDGIMLPEVRDMLHTLEVYA